LEGDLSVVGEDTGIDNNKIENLIRDNVWNRMNQNINDVIDGITLKDIIDEYEKNSDFEMYYI
jgi:DNA-binding IscR family transcriptional regulator